MVVGVADDEGWHGEDGKARGRKREKMERKRETVSIVDLTTPLRRLLDPFNIIKPFPVFEFERKNDFFVQPSVFISQLEVLR